MAKKSKNKNSGSRVTQLRLSQCMIVKNEENNIIRALSWAKDVAFEQIVVDTGSTDRTVEIAEKMGAKVYHFDWIDDFSAAKNYAIEQASGNWIAFLDADEYFTPEDTKKLINRLNDPAFYKNFKILRCPWVHLDNDGKPFAIHEQERVFRNLPEIRYREKIHEYLTKDDEIGFDPELSILHTGYSEQSYKDAGKAERNVRMLYEKFGENPTNANDMIYLADSLRIDPDEAMLVKAEKLYYDAVHSGQADIVPFLKQSAYSHLLALYSKHDEKMPEFEKLCRMAVSDFPENPDYIYFYAAYFNKIKDYTAAWKYLLDAEALLFKDGALPASRLILTNPILLFFEMAITAQALGDNANMIKYSTLVLKEDKRQSGIVTPYISTLVENSVSYDEILDLLGKIYDLGNIEDKIFLLRAAKNTGYMDFAKKVLSLITPEEQSWLSGGGK